MGLSVSSGDIVIRDRDGRVKMDLTTRHPVVLEQIDGVFSVSENVLVNVDSFANKIDVESGYYVYQPGNLYNMIGDYSLQPKIIRSKIISSLSPDFLLIKARIITNLESKDIALSSSCIASLGLPAMGVRTTNTFGNQLNAVKVVDPLGSAVTCLLHVSIENGLVVMDLDMAHNFVKFNSASGVDFTKYSNWLTYRGVLPGNTIEYTYQYNVRVEYSISLMKFMGS